MFTNNQIDEIRKKLLLLGVKDTTLPDGTILSGEELVTIVQNGINKKVKVRTLLEGAGFDPSIFTAQVSNVDSTEEPRASVYLDKGKFNFMFGLPKGKDGRDGIDGDTPISYRSVMIFKTSEDKPNTPVGGAWDIVTDSIIYPEGWSPSDDLKGIIWMSIGQFNSVAPSNPKWSIPVRISGENGKNGEDGNSIEFIYILTKTQLDVPNTPTDDVVLGTNPGEWTDSPSGIGEYYQVEWVSTRKRNSNGEWESWGIPVIWSKWGTNGQDGDGVQYIYKRNKGEILDNPTPYDTTTDEYQQKGEYENIEYIPDEWNDNPLGVSLTYTHEWVSVRKCKNGVWQSFSNPTLWARFGENGTNGISVRKMYTKTNSSSEPPVVISDNINPGSRWGLSMPNYTYPEAVWAIEAYVSYDNKLVSITDEEGKEVYGWQGPIIISGIAGKDGVPINYKTTVFKLSNSGTPPKPTFDNPKYPTDNWQDYPSTIGQWYSCTGMVNGYTDLIATDENGNLEWGAVLPVNGKDGTAQDGKHWETRFASSVNSIAPDINRTERYPDRGIVGDAAIGTMWVKVDINTPPPTIPIGGSLWETLAEINSDDTLVSGWCMPFRVNGETGPTGATGPAGPIGPMGPSGLSGVPGTELIARYCIGKDTSYIATYNDTVSKDTEPSEYGWSAVIPSVTKDNPYVWCIQARFKYERVASTNTFEKVLDGTWSTPFRLSGINGIDAKGVGISSVDEYYLVSSKSSGITISSTGWQKNTIPAFTSTDIYLWNYEVINYDNGTSSEPTTPALLGNKSKDGKGIASITEKYAASADPNNHPATTSTKWKDNPPATSTDEPYLWNWEHIVYTEGEPSDFFAVIGTRGADGKDGNNGINQIIYPAGIYDENTTYRASDQKAPYVFDENAYYVLNVKDADVKGVKPSLDYANNKGLYWMLMESFDAIFANIGIIGSGLIGSAVYNGDYMFSQQGKNGKYEDFNPTTKYTPSTSFDPNICINFKTGEAWFGCGLVHFNYDGSGDLANGKIKLNADGSATIGGFVITDSTIGLKDTDFRNGLVLGEDGSIDIFTQKGTGNGGTQVSLLKYDGQQLTLEQSYLGVGTTPQMTALVVSSGDTVFRIDSDGIFGKTGTNGTFINLLDKPETTSSNIQIVTQKPSTTNPNTLYVIV